MAASRDAITADGALVEPRHCAVHLTRRLRVDNAVDTEVLRVLKQLGIDAAVKALMAQTSEISAAQGNSNWRWQEAHFSAACASK